MNRWYKPLPNGWFGSGAAYLLACGKKHHNDLSSEDAVRCLASKIDMRSGCKWFYYVWFGFNSKPSSTSFAHCLSFLELVVTSHVYILFWCGLWFLKNMCRSSNWWYYTGGLGCNFVLIIVCHLQVCNKPEVIYHYFKVQFLLLDHFWGGCNNSVHLIWVCLKTSVLRS